MLATRYNFVVRFTRSEGDTLEGVDVRSGNAVRVKLRLLSGVSSRRRTSIESLGAAVVPGAHISAERCSYDDGDNCYRADFVKPLTLSNNDHDHLVLNDVMVKLWPIADADGGASGFVDVLCGHDLVTEVTSLSIERAIIDLYLRHDWRLGRPFVMVRPQNADVDVSYSLPVIGKSRCSTSGSYNAPSKQEAIEKLNAHSQSFSRLISTLSDPNSAFYNQPFELVPGCRFNLNSCLAGEPRLINLQRAVYTDSKKNKPRYRHSTIAFKKYKHSADYFVVHIVPSLADGNSENYSARLPSNVPLMVSSISSGAL